MSSSDAIDHDWVKATVCKIQGHHGVSPGSDNNSEQSIAKQKKLSLPKIKRSQTETYEFKRGFDGRGREEGR